MFESLVMRDGLCNAPATFQHFLNDIFRDMIGNGIWVYIDDILIYSDTAEGVAKLICEVLNRLRVHALYLNAKKSEFLTEEISFLGHVISATGIKTDPKKTEAIRTFPLPKNLRELRGALGLSSYYRKFVPNFSEIARPLTELTKKDIPFVMNDK